MTAVEAKKLHNGDEVIDKGTNEACKVLTVKVLGRYVVVDVITPKNTYRQLTHVEIR